MAAGHRRTSLFWPGVLIGIGTAGTLDEVVLHQLLGWHHFYDRSTPSVGLLSDGLFHLPYDLAFLALAAIVALIGAVLLRQAHARQPAP
jgi:uncharacterized membrane protein